MGTNRSYRFRRMVLLPSLLAANTLVAYKFNKARKVRGVEAYDDKHFTSYEKIA